MAGFDWALARVREQQNWLVAQRVNPAGDQAPRHHRDCQGEVSRGIHNRLGYSTLFRLAAHDEDHN